jgi:hypothetical protein
MKKAWIVSLLVLFPLSLYAIDKATTTDLQKTTEKKTVVKWVDKTIATVVPKNLRSTPTSNTDSIFTSFFSEFRVSFLFVKVDYGLESLVSQNILPIWIEHESVQQKKRIGTVHLALKPDRSSSMKFRVKIYFSNLSSSTGTLKVEPWASSDAALRSEYAYTSDPNGGWQDNVFTTKYITISNTATNAGLTNINEPNDIDWTIWGYNDTSFTVLNIKKVELEAYTKQ